jgi:hypothetical protein
VYSPEEGFYLLTFTGQAVTYCFDVRGTLENGSYRVTRWPSTKFTSFTRLDNGTLYIGTNNGISTYTGYSDNGNGYRFKYYSPSLTFGDSSRVKILKKLKPTLVGANNATVFLKWAYDFKTTYATAEFTVGNQITGFYGESEYTTVEFTAGQLTNARSLNTTGYGTSVQVGLDVLGELGSYLAQPEVLLPGVVGGLLTGEAYGRLSDIGRQARTGAEELAATQLEQTQFRPFTVTTATGAGMGTQVTPEGGIETTMGLSPQEIALQNQLLGGAGGFFGQAVQPTVDREQAIFERMRRTQRPEEERQRLATEERMAAQGRLGLSSAAYGGATPELLAQQTAINEARNRAMLAAMQQAQAEQMQQAALGQQFLGAGYLPQQQLMAATQPAQQLAALQQQAQLQGAGLFGEATMSGLEAQLVAEQARANLLGQTGAGLLSGALTPRSTGNSSLISALGSIFGQGGS